MVSGSPAGEKAIAALQRCFAEEDGIAELGIGVALHGDEVILSGQVESAERRAHIERKVNEILPGMTVHNDIGIIPTRRPDGSEEVS